MGNINERIRKVRKNNDLTQDSFSERLGLEKPTQVKMVEYGKQQAPAELLQRIIEIFNVDAHWLLTGQGDMYRAGSAGITQRTVYEKNGIAVHNNHGNIGVGEQFGSGHGGRGDRLQAFVAHWMATHDADDQVWLVKQVERAVPEFVDFDLENER